MSGEEDVGALQLSWWTPDWEVGGESWPSIMNAFLSLHVTEAGISASSVSLWLECWVLSAMWWVNVICHGILLLIFFTDPPTCTALSYKELSSPGCTPCCSLSQRVVLGTSYSRYFLLLQRFPMQNFIRLLLLFFFTSTWRMFFFTSTWRTWRTFMDLDFSKVKCCSK